MDNCGALVDVHTIGVIGGTGPQGRGLAYRFALGGHNVILGSRSRTRATEAADDLNGLLGASAVVRGGDNHEAVEASDVVLLAVPYDGHRELLEELCPALTGKVVISCVNPLGFDRVGPYGLAVAEGSAAEQAAAVLPDSAVVAAFHHVAAATLLKTVDDDEHEDVLVCGDDAEAKEIVVELASTVSGRLGVDAGPLRMARYLEPLTAVLIAVNKRYKTRSGIAVTGLRKRG